MPDDVPTPTSADVARIAAEPDVVLRNVLITQAYHDLAEAVRRQLGEGGNWCAFAVWASRQAGHTIRGQDLEDMLRERLGGLPELRELVEIARGTVGPAAVRSAGDLASAVIEALEPEGAVRRAAAAVAAGNQLVFGDIGGEVAGYLQAMEEDGSNGVARFLAGLRPGDPPEGQALLRRAFEAFTRLEAETAPGTRAQLLYLANLLIAMHEQVRAQPLIAEAMDVGFDERAADRIVAELLPGWWRRVRYRIAALFGRRPPLDALAGRLVDAARRELRELITSQMMTLALPAGVVLRLGEDVVGQHAPDLAAITDPQLEALLARIDPGQTTLGSAALDWSVLEQRLRFIAELFRCYQGSATLFGPPYAPEQVERLRAGLLPGPPL